MSEQTTPNYSETDTTSDFDSIYNQSTCDETQEQYHFHDNQANYNPEQPQLSNEQKMQILQENYQLKMQQYQLWIQRQQIIERSRVLQQQQIFLQNSTSVHNYSLQKPFPTHRFEKN